MRRILEYELYQSFRDYVLMESFTPEGNPRWPSNWKDMDLWKDLQSMGFEDVTTPLQAKNATIMLVNKRFPHMYPHGVVLQASGYVRDKAARSGFIKSFKGTDYTLETLLNYIKERWSKEEVRMNPEEVGPLSPEQIQMVIGSTKSPWRWNSTTNSLDVDGEFIFSVNSKESMDLLNFKFGKVKGAFTLFFYRSFLADSLDGIWPDSAKEISIYSERYTRSGIKSTKGITKKVKGGISIYGISLDSLEDVPLDIKSLRTQYFDVEPFNVQTALQVLEEGSVKTYWGQGGKRIKHDSDASKEDDDRAKELILTVLSDEYLDAYFKKNPLNLYYLDKHPVIKAGVLKRTGLRDLSSLGKNIASKWI